jgi:hypothetical protein
MKQAIAMLFAMCMLLSGVGVAADISYDQIRLNYVSAEFDAGPVDVDGDGLELSGSFSFADSFFGFGSYSDLDLDFNLDASILEIGGGYHRPITTMLDFVARVGYVRTDLDTPFGDADDDGVSLSGGVRGRMTDAIEVKAALNYFVMDKGDNDTEVELAGDYFITERIALGAGLCLGDDVTTWTVGGRYNFQ